MKASESDLKDYEGVCSKDNLVISEDFKKKVDKNSAYFVLNLIQS